MAKLGDGNFLAGASGAAVNEMMQKELSKIKDPALHQWASAAVGAAVGGIVGGKTGVKSGASTAAMGTKENRLKTSVMPVEVQVIIFPIRAEYPDGIPHACLKFVYPGQESNEELHYGPYVQQARGYCIKLGK
jgi:hypothetical protein